MAKAIEVFINKIFKEIIFPLNSILIFLAFVAFLQDGKRIEKEF